MEYEVTTAQFTGPLDLLLHLVREHEMDLYDLDVALICDQYLAYIEKMDPTLLEAMSEYLVMAAWLCEMKSKLLIPNEQLDDEEDDYEAQRRKMIRMLIEKNRINGVLEAFDDAFETRQQMHSRMPADLEYLSKDMSSSLPEDLEVYDLLVAMQNVLKRKKAREPLESTVTRVEITIEERTDQIENYFRDHRGTRVNFADLFEGRDKYFAIVTFLSVLVLVKNERLTITQDKRFGDIYLEGREDDHGKE